MWRRLKAAGFRNVALNTQPGLNHVSYSAKEMELNAAFLISLFPFLSIDSNLGPRSNGAVKTGWLRWLIGLVDMRWVVVALWNSVRALARTLLWKRPAQKQGTVESGSAVRTTPPVVTAALTSAGTDWAKAAAADMARRNAPPSAPSSAPLRLAKGANAGGSAISFSNR